jgi:peptidoglycan hydrolase CwlO-like protein
MYFWHGFNNDVMDYNTQFWKSRAADRSAEIKELKKRIEEVKIGREKWKAKYMKSNEEVIKYKKELDSIKKKIVKILSN